MRGIGNAKMDAANACSCMSVLHSSVIQPHRLCCGKTCVVPMLPAGYSAV
jgi:hypothetical protein